MQTEQKNTETQMINLILDTDFETDCDDVGALAVLHSLAQRGIVNILGVIASVNSPYPAAAVAAVNAALGRPDIPVGENRTIPNAPCYLKHRENTQDRSYCEAIAKELPQNNTQDAIALYLNILNRVADSSVTICSIGLMTVLAEVMRRPGGTELIRRKVIRLISMANGLPEQGNSGFNWNMDPDATESVINHWPVELVISPVGSDVLTGSSLTALPADNPLRKAYEIWCGDVGCLRPSWDQLAVLSACHVAFQEGFVKTIRRGKIVYDGNRGEHCWRKDEEGLHVCVNLCRNAEETAHWVESHMLNAWNFLKKSTNENDENRTGRRLWAWWK